MQQPSIAPMDHFNLAERMKVFKPKFTSKKQEWCGTLNFLFRRFSIKNERSLNNQSSISMISNPQGVKRRYL